MAIERITPGTKEWDAFYANHLFRYAFAKEQIENAKAINILDAACGVGYGSFFLGANENLRITSIDKSTQALEIGVNKFARDNISYIEDDCHTLKNASFFGPYDCIVSFETLEHLPKPDLFIKSCYNNLKQKGKLVISTPNQLVSSPDGRLNWEFHEKEYTVPELIKILSNAGFSRIEIFGQQMTTIGLLREQLRAELNKINSNPFIRIGKKIQQILKKHKFSSVLPEKAEDFEIKAYDEPKEIMIQQQKGPFVLIAVCEKP